MNPIYRGQLPPKNTNVLWIKGDKIFIYTENGWEQSSTDEFEVDDTIIQDSENPVQSNTIQDYLTDFKENTEDIISEKQDALTFDSELSDTSSNPIKNNAVYNQYITNGEIEEILYPFKDYSKEYLTIVVYSVPNPIYKTIHISDFNTDASLEYSLDNGTTWKDAEDIIVSAGDKIMIRAKTEVSSIRKRDNVLCNNMGIDIMGNLASLATPNKAHFSNVLTALDFSNAFSASNPGVRHAENLYIPLSNSANTSLKTMFNKNEHLLTAPKILPLTDLSGSNQIYYLMFNECLALLEAPELPATILGTSSYYRMFDGCSSLSRIKCLATNISASNCTKYWVRNVSSGGTFIKNSNMSNWTNGTNGIPSGWTVQNA